MGYAGATGADYQRLMKGGFLLEYTDGGACKACTDSGGRCRVGASDDVFASYCTDSNDLFICGSGRNGTTKKIVLIVSVSIAASLLLPCIYVLVRQRKRP
ncbi:unnamed protein product [Urochloa humidicola]